MSMSLKARFVSYLHQKYPQLSVPLLEQLMSEELLSPFQISLSQEQIQSLKNEITGYWNLRNWGHQNLNSQFTQYDLRKPDNFSVCMSYDFHINAAGQPELIEINTNAAFLALGLELYQFLNLTNPAGSFGEADLIEMFLNEIRLCGPRGAKENSIAIVDENPQQQRLYLEFLIYKALFEKYKIPAADVFDIRDIEKFKKYSLIYNRYTDFYLQESKSADIKNLFNEGRLNLSPQPYEYFLLADKQRFLDWNQQSDLPKPSSLLKTYDLAVENKDKIWSERKTLFFKPKNSFGGKQAYRGASLSRKIFEEVCQQNFIAQQFSAPSTISGNLSEQTQPLNQESGQTSSQAFKYDLRCFVYKNELQLIIARLYQGQITNLKTPGGGFACIIVS